MASFKEQLSAALSLRLNLSFAGVTGDAPATCNAAALAPANHVTSEAVPSPLVFFSGCYHQNRT